MREIVGIFWRVVLVVEPCFLHFASIRLYIPINCQKRMVAQLPQKLQRLEDMPLRFGRVVVSALRASDNFLCFLSRSGTVKLLVEQLLNVRQFAIEVLDDLGRQIVEDIFLQASQQERQDLFVQCIQGESS